MHLLVLSNYWTAYFPHYQLLVSMALFDIQRFYHHSCCLFSYYSGSKIQVGQTKSIDFSLLKFPQAHQYQPVPQQLAFLLSVIF